MLNERKVVQMAAFFLDRSPQRTMPRVKLMGLLYLSEREAVRVFGRPMAGGRLVSMLRDQILSQTINLMNGNVEFRPGCWDAWISNKDGPSLRLSLQPDVLDELSPAEINLLNTVWKQFGGMGQWEMRDWISVNCAELDGQHGSPISMNFEDLARAVGYDENTAREVATQIQEEQEIDKIFAAL